MISNNCAAVLRREGGGEGGFIFLPSEEPGLSCPDSQVLSVLIFSSQGVFTCWAWAIRVDDQDWFICKNLRYFFSSRRWARLPLSTEFSLVVSWVSQLSVDQQGEVPGREMTTPRSPGCSPPPSLASHVLTGDYFAGKLANTRANTRADTSVLKNINVFTTQLEKIHR